jgi:hypothetical protein
VNETVNSRVDVLDPFLRWRDWVAK